MSYDIGIIGDSLHATRAGVTATDTAIHKIAANRWATYLNKAVSGDYVTDMAARVVTDFGGQNVKHTIFAPGYNDAGAATDINGVYKPKMREVVAKLRDTGSIVKIVTPMMPLLSSQVAALEAYNEATLDTAYLLGVDTIDVYGYSSQYAARNYAAYASLFNLTATGGGQDPHHYGPAGHTFIADIFEKPRYASLFPLRRFSIIIPPASGAWQTIAEYIHDREGVNWSNCTQRTEIAASVFENASPDEVRVTLRASTGGFKVSGARIGYNTGSIGVAPAFDVAPEPLLKGGASSWTVPAGEDVTDAIISNRPSGKNVVIEVYNDGSGPAYASGRNAPLANVVSWWKNGNQLGVLSGAGFTKASQSTVHLVKKIEGLVTGD